MRTIGSRHLRHGFGFLWLGLLFGLASLGAAAPKKVKLPNAAEIERMREALPTARVKPAKPRRLLVFTLCRGYRHSSIPYGAKALELMGRQTGAFEAVVSDDPALLRPESLAGFDGLLMLNTTMRLPILGVDPKTLSGQAREKAEAGEKAVRKGILDFVRGGKGLIGIHAATDCLYKWPEYGELIGAYFNGHPWHERVTIKLDDPGHPLCRVFKGQPFSITDEIYQFRAPYSREKLRVLLSLDTTRTNMDKGKKIRREDGDFAVAWIREYGRGRVYYCSLGHREEIYWNPSVLQFYLDGIQYALGDLPADATPSAELSSAYLKKSRRLAHEIGLAAIFSELAHYKMGTDDTAARLLDALVVAAQAPEAAGQRRDLSRRLVGLLRLKPSEDATRFACRQLALIGGPEAVPVLEALLREPRFAEVARYALERIPGREAEEALLRALPAAPPKIGAGIIDSLGARRAQKAVPALAAALASPSVAVRQAAALALGDIGTPAAADALLGWAAGTASANLGATGWEGLLRCGDRLAATAGFFSRGRRQAALKCYDAVLAAKAPGHLRATAFAGRCQQLGEKALPEIRAQLLGHDPLMARRAAALLGSLPGKSMTAAAISALDEAPPALQVQLLNALARRGDRQAVAAVLEKINAGDAAVRLAALQALERLGSPAAVLPLARRAAAAKETPAGEHAAARRSLGRMVGKGIDARCEQALAGAPPPVRCELIRALGARLAVAAVPALFVQARDADREVRKEALKALAVLAGPEDLGELIRLLAAAKSVGDRSRTVTMIVAIVRRMKIPDEGARRVTAALAIADLSVKARGALLEALGKIGAPAGLPALYAALKDARPDVRKAAIKALAGWPDAAPMAHLREVSLHADSRVHRVLALRGYARMLAMPSRRPMAETLKRYREAFRLAQGDMEKKSLLTGLAGVCHPEALAIARSYVDDPALRADAFMAAARIMTALDGAAMKVTASCSGGRDVPNRAIDNTRKTRWTSGARQKGGEWFQIDLGYEAAIREIYLAAGDTGSDWPRGYEVYVSSDGKEWGRPVVTGQGKKRIFTIRLPAVPGRFIRIVQTGTSTGNFWSIADLKINGLPDVVPPEKLAPQRKKWKATASSSPADAGKAIDGDPETRWTTGHAMRRGDWLMVDMGEVKTVRRVYLDAAKSSRDYPRACEIHVSTDGKNWLGPIGMVEGKSALTVVPVLPTPARFVKVLQTGADEQWFWSVHELNIDAR